MYSNSSSSVCWICVIVGYTDTYVWYDIQHDVWVLVQYTIGCVCVSTIYNSMCGWVLVRYTPGCMGVSTIYNRMCGC